LITRRTALAGLLTLPNTAQSKSTHSIWVFGLLHPDRLNIYPQPGSRLHCTSPSDITVIELPDEPLRVRANTTPLQVTGPNGSPVSLILEVPGVIRRAYRGTLGVIAKGTLLIPVVTMHSEMAVASIVGAELPTAAAPFHALAAQAVIARSFLVSSPAPRHAQADFCDTTHCQFLRSPARDGTLTDQAVKSTSSLILHAGAQRIPARYSAACGGHTDSRFEEGYLYQSVNCEVCVQQGLPRRGHGLGLCQEGAIGLARAGWHWRAILDKYYPGASVQTMP
jgi:peptidoglycan hydrolase-like amidase